MYFTSIVFSEGVPLADCSKAKSSLFLQNHQNQTPCTLLPIILM